MGWWLELSLADSGKRGWFGWISLKKQVDESFDPKESVFLFPLHHRNSFEACCFTYFFKSRGMTLNECFRDLHLGGVVLESQQEKL